MSSNTHSIIIIVSVYLFLDLTICLSIYLSIYVDIGIGDVPML